MTPEELEPLTAPLRDFWRRLDAPFVAAQVKELDALATGDAVAAKAARREYYTVAWVRFLGMLLARMERDIPEARRDAVKEEVLAWMAPKLEDLKRLLDDI